MSAQHFKMFNILEDESKIKIGRCEYIDVEFLRCYAPDFLLNKKPGGMLPGDYASYFLYALVIPEAFKDAVKDLIEIE